MSSDHIHALLIGIEDYRAYDASLGRAEGTSDLRGAANDVALFRQTLTALGVPEANVQTLTGRRGEGGATRTDLEAALDAFAARLSNEASRGLLLFCGHGDADARGPLLCPTDVTVDLARALPFSEVAARLDRRRQRAGVACFLDACHVASGGAARAGLHPRALRGQQALVPAVRRLARDEDVVLAASAPGEASHEYRLHGRWHGAFTWAVTSLLDRFGRARSDGGFALTWDELGRRAAHLLRELEVDQTPTYAGSDRARRHHVLGGPGPRGPVRPTTESVARELPDEVDGYVIDNAGTIVGWLDVAASTLVWHWTSSGAAWPASFKLKSGTPPSTSYTVTTERSTFPGSSGSYSVTGLKYKLKQGGSTVGYMDPGASVHSWFIFDAQSEYDAANMDFAVNTDTGNKTLYRVLDDVL